MIVATGREPVVVSAAVAAIGDRGEQALAWTFDPEDPESDLVARMRELDAHVVVVVEELGRHDGDRPARPDSVLLEEALRAGRSAHAARIVFVTQRPAEDASLARLRRSGVGYAIIRPAPLVGRELDAIVQGGVVWVPQDLSPPPFGVCTVPMLAEVIADTACTGAHVGSTVDVGAFGANAWSDLIRAAGGEPRLASPWRVALASALGQTSLRALAELRTRRRHP